MNSSHTTSTQTPVLTIRNLSKHLGNKKILSDINLDVFPGEVFGFLGPNGSGKTTTIKLVLGLLKMETGSISICGHDNVKEFEKAVANVGGIIENPEMYKYLSGRENLEQYARMYDNIPAGRIDEVVKIVRLEERINDKISKYSLGMRQRLGVAQALLNSPKILILDEPTNGLDPAGIKELRELLIDLAHRENVAVFISSHLLAELDLLCDRICIIDRGAVVDTMTIEEVRKSGEGANSTLSVEIDPATASKIPEKFAGILSKKSESEYTAVLPHESVPETIAELCADGVRIYSVSMVKHSIEDVFLSLTAEYTPAGAGGSKNYMPHAKNENGGDAQ